MDTTLHEIKSTRDPDVLIAYMYEQNNQQLEPSIIFHHDTGVTKSLEVLRQLALDEYRTPRDLPSDLPIPSMDLDNLHAVEWRRDPIPVEAARVWLMANNAPSHYLFHSDGRPIDTLEEILAV